MKGWVKPFNIQALLYQSPPKILLGRILLDRTNAYCITLRRSALTQPTIVPPALRWQYGTIVNSDPEESLDDYGSKNGFKRES